MAASILPTISISNDSHPYVDFSGEGTTAAMTWANMYISYDNYGPKFYANEFRRFITVITPARPTKVVKARNMIRVLAGSHPVRS